MLLYELLQVIHKKRIIENETAKSTFFVGLLNLSYPSVKGTVHRMKTSIVLSQAYMYSIIQRYINIYFG